MHPGHPRYSQFAILSTACVVPLLLLAACANSVTESSHSNWRSLGVYQARIGSIRVADSLRRLDTLVVDYTADPDTGICPTLGPVEVVRDSMHLDLTVWMEARAWIGSGPPPPCAFPIFRFLVPPPFAVGWFALRGHQPDGTEVRDSTLVRPS